MILMFLQDNIIFRVKVWFNLFNEEGNLDIIIKMKIKQRIQNMIIYIYIYKIILSIDSVV